jgi:hypothetical protein
MFWTLFGAVLSPENTVSYDEILCIRTQAGTAGELFLGVGVQGVRSTRNLRGVGQRDP